MTGGLCSRMRRGSSRRTTGWCRGSPIRSSPGSSRSARTRRSGPKRIAAILGRFRQTFPGSKVEFVVNQSRLLRPLIEGGRIDVAALQVSESELRPDDRVLWYDELRWATHRDLPFEAGVVPARHLRGERLLSPGARTDPRAARHPVPLRSDLAVHRRRAGRRRGRLGGGGSARTTVRATRSSNGSAVRTRPSAGLVPHRAFGARREQRCDRGSRRGHRFGTNRSSSRRRGFVVRPPAPRWQVGLRDPRWPDR